MALRTTLYSLSRISQFMKFLPMKNWINNSASNQSMMSCKLQTCFMSKRIIQVDLVFDDLLCVFFYFYVRLQFIRTSWLANILLTCSLQESLSTIRVRRL